MSETLELHKLIIDLKERIQKLENNLSSIASSVNASSVAGYLGGDLEVDGWLKISEAANTYTQTESLDAIYKWITSLLTGNAAAGQKIVNVTDGSKYSVTEYDGACVIKDGSNRENNYIAEINGNQLTMLNNLSNTYTTASNAIVNQWNPEDFPESTDDTFNKLTFKDTDSLYAHHSFLIMVGSDPIRVWDQGAIFKKDIAAGGFVSANQGVYFYGHGLNFASDPPKDTLLHSGATLNGTASSGQKTIPVVSSYGIIEGDVITVIDDSNSESAVVASVDDTHVYVVSNLTYSYTVAASARIYNYDTKHVCRLDGSHAGIAIGKTLFYNYAGTLTAQIDGESGDGTFGNVNPISTGTKGLGSASYAWLGVVGVTGYFNNHRLINGEYNPLIANEIGSSTTDASGDDTVAFSVTYSTAPKVFIQAVDASGRGIVIDRVSVSTTQFVVKARKVTGITSQAKTAGTPSGTNAEVSAGTPSGSVTGGTHRHYIDISTDTDGTHTHDCGGPVGSPATRSVQECSSGCVDVASDVHYHDVDDSVSANHAHAIGAYSNYDGGHSHTFTGSPLGTHGHTFTGDELATHTHTVDALALAVSYDYIVFASGAIV